MDSSKRPRIGSPPAQLGTASAPSASGPGSGSTATHEEEQSHKITHKHSGSEFLRILSSWPRVGSCVRGFERPSSEIPLVVDLLYKHGKQQEAEFELKFGTLRDRDSRVRIKPPILTAAALEPNTEFYFDAQIEGPYFKKLNTVLNKTLTSSQGRMSYAHVREVDMFYPGSVRITRKLPDGFAVQSARRPSAPNTADSWSMQAATEERDVAAVLQSPKTMFELIQGFWKLDVLLAVKKTPLEHVNVYVPRSGPADYRLSAKLEQPLDRASAPEHLGLSDSASLPSQLSNHFVPTRLRFKDRMRYKFEIWSFDLTLVRTLVLTGNPSESDTFEMELELAEPALLTQQCVLAHQSLANHLLYIAETWVALQSTLSRAMW